MFDGIFIFVTLKKIIWKKTVVCKYNTILALPDIYNVRIEKNKKYKKFLIDDLKLSEKWQNYNDDTATYCVTLQDYHHHQQ